ncbi:MAG: hypothetical protein ACLUIX_10720 [Oscillospiraceae bacterium]
MGGDGIIASTPTGSTGYSMCRRPSWSQRRNLR